MASEGAFAVSRLGPGDAPLLRELNALFSDVFDDAESYASRPPSQAYVERLLADDGVIALVARAGEETIGGLVAYDLRKFEQERSEVYIYDLGVREAHRRRGVATALIGRLTDIAAERSAWVVYVQADQGDDAAIALYTKLGAREDVMHFDIATPRQRRGRRATPPWFRTAVAVSLSAGRRPYRERDGSKAPPPLARREPQAMTEPTHADHLRDVRPGQPHWRRRGGRDLRLADPQQEQ